MITLGTDNEQGVTHGLQSAILVLLNITHFACHGGMVGLLYASAKDNPVVQGRLRQ
jgi:hypothetical protein